MNMLHNLSKSTKIFIALVVAYLLSTFIMPASEATKDAYQLSNSEYAILLLVVRLPVVALWCIVFYGYRQLHAYVNRLKETPESHDFSSIERGMFWIAWGLPVPALISALLYGMANSNSDFRIFSLIATNYLYVIVALFAFSYILSGTHSLANRVQLRFSARYIRLLIAIFVAIGALFCYLISAKLGSGLSHSGNTYFLSNFFVWTTVVVPYLFAWFVGLFAALELMTIARTTKGIIYSRALQLLAAGIMLTILSMFAMQYFRSIVPRDGYLTIGGALLMTYLIYGVQAIGAGLVAAGARRLRKIEEA